MKEFKLKCETHEIAANLTAFLNKIPQVKAEDLGGEVKITFQTEKKPKPLRG